MEELMAKQGQGQRVTLVGMTLPIKTATDIRAISARSGRNKSHVGRQFFEEHWDTFLANHPDLKAMTEAGIPESESAESAEPTWTEAESPAVTDTAAEPSPEKSESEIAATA